MTYVPGRSAIEALGSVVPTLTVATHNKDLITDPVTTSIAVEVLDILGETLPLSLVTLARVLGVSGISAVQEAKVPLSLKVVSMSLKPQREKTYVVERLGVSSRVILHEEFRDGRVLDLLVLGKVPVGQSSRRQGQEGGNDGQLHFEGSVETRCGPE